MISHKHKCIFVHIPRTAGSSIEKMICGKDWWSIDAKTKHITASTSKEIYSEYWDDYFKFAFVRNPWSRAASLSLWPNHYGSSIKDGKIDLREYAKKHHPLNIDYRSIEKNKEIKVKFPKGGVYLNTLGEDLDFIGKFENLKSDISYIKEKLKIKTKMPHVQKGSFNTKDYRKLFSDDSKRIIQECHELDVQKFGYEF
jgi:hypothetical protein